MGSLLESRQESGNISDLQAIKWDKPMRVLSIIETDIITTINNAFKNWHEPWKETFLNEAEGFMAVYDAMEALMHYEEQVTASEVALSNDRLNAIAQAVARLVDYGNAILNMDVIIRKHNDETSRELDPSEVTTIELYQAHIRAQKLRDKLLMNYFKRETLKRFSSDSDNVTNSSSPIAPNHLTIPSDSSPHSNLPSPRIERSHRLSAGSNMSINTSLPFKTTSSSHENVRPRTPSQVSINSLMTQSFIELKQCDRTKSMSASINSLENDLSSSQLETKQMTATIQSIAFAVPSNGDTRRALLSGVLAKIESLLLVVPTNQLEKITLCFELLNVLFDVVEKLPIESRREEVFMIANSLLKPLVHKVYVDDRDNCIEFQHSHWTTYLLSLIRLLNTTDFNFYLRTFTNLPDLSAFLKDYLFIVKRFITSKSDDCLDAHEPFYPTCWIEMNLLVCSTFLKSMIYLYQTLKQCFASNLQMWNSYIDCMVRFILNDSLQPGRPMFKERQVLQAIDLRKTSAEYVCIAWDCLNFDQKHQILEDLIEPLLRCCMILDSNQRSILLPIFYGMMRCDYTCQYITPRSGATSGSTITGLHSQLDCLNLCDRFSNSNFLSDEDFDDDQTVVSDCSRNSSMSHMVDESISGVQRRTSGESLPYLSLKDANNSSISEDGTVLTRFTHLIIGKLHSLMVDLNMGDESFKDELCSAIAGQLDSKYTPSNHLSLLTPSASLSNSASEDLDQFRHMARHTSDLVAEFMQICLDSRQANRLSHNHLHLLCLFKLILFFRDKVDRSELYLVNLHKLWCLHHSKGRFVEAGFTLLELAKSIPWSNQPLEKHYRIITRSLQTSEPLLDYTGLKIFLYTTIIEYFDQGQLWEAAVPLCHELIDIYQHRMYDYIKLSETHIKLANFFSNIISNGNVRGSCRAHPEYFRVTFYGVGFPESILGSTMVYRGKPFEKLSDFQATISSKYSDAKLLNTLAKPDDQLINEPDAKYLQINACTPVVDLKLKVNSEFISKIPDPVVEYYKRNECDKFEYSRRIAHDNVGSSSVACTSANEFAGIWRERTTLTTNSLPGMLPFFPVFLTETNIISPIECAIEDLERANDRLLSMVNRFKADKNHEEDVRPLGQLLLGIVDAAVNGGITKYEEAFFNTSTTTTAKHGDSGTSSKTTYSDGVAIYAEHQTQVPSSPSAVSHTKKGNSYGQLSVSAPAKTTSSESTTGHLSSINAISDNTAEARQHHGPSFEQVEKLKTLIARQVPLLDDAIRLHRDRVADVMLPQHEHLEASCKKLKYHIVSKYSRYLPADYVRAKSSIMRSYRSLARSPNRSSRSNSNTPGGASTLGRLGSKKLSDASNGPRPRVNTVTTVFDETSSARNHRSINSISIPYRQLNNERRSLPFITGVPAADGQRPRPPPRQFEPLFVDSDASDQEMPMSLESCDASKQANTYFIPPPVPPPIPTWTSNHTSPSIVRAAPPPPTIAAPNGGDPPYVCVTDLFRKVVTPSGARNLPYARLDDECRQSFFDASSSKPLAEHKPGSDCGSRADFRSDEPNENRIGQESDEVKLVSL